MIRARPRLLSVGGAGGVAQVGFGAVVITYADETDFKLSATAAGPLRCDEYVHVGVSPVPHVIHEADLPAEEIQVAKKRRTVQEHAEEIFLLPGCFLSGEVRWGKACPEEERTEDIHNHFVLFVDGDSDRAKGLVPDPSSGTTP